MLRVLSAVTAAAALTAAPAVAGTVIWNFKDVGGAQSSVSKLSGVTNATVTPLRVVSLNGGTNLSSLGGQKLADVTSSVAALAGGAAVTSPLLLSRQAAGLGVVNGANEQLDTNNAARREAVLLTASAAFSLSSVQLGNVDPDDTLQIYGVQADGTLVSLGFPGVITNTSIPATTGLTSLDDAGTVTDVAGGLKNVELKVATGFYDRYLFTTRELGSVSYLGTNGQGYTLAQVAGAVPEPGTWALMIGGFGLVGASLRRRQAVAAAV